MPTEVGLIAMEAITQLFSEYPELKVRLSGLTLDCHFLFL